MTTLASNSRRTYPVPPPTRDRMNPAQGHSAGSFVLSFVAGVVDKAKDKAIDKVWVAGETRLVLFLALAFSAAAQDPSDWPTYLKNNQRNGVTDEELAPPLSEAWVHQAAFPPQPAWPPPASQNYYGGVFGIEPWATHENALQVSVSGDTLYYGAPATHAVYAVDIATGKPRWTFFTEGPVRYAPAVANGKVYFGSDDGYIHCLDTQGKLLWKTRIAQADRRLPGNGHMISMWPVRGGIIVEDGKGYACAGVFPEQGVHRCSFDPETGKILWRNFGGFFDGYLVLAGNRIAVSGGRVGGGSFNIQDGKPADGFGGRGTYLVSAGSNFVAQAGSQRSLTLAGSGLAADFLVHRDGVTYVLGRKDATALRADDWVRASRARGDAEKSLKNAQGALGKIKKDSDAAAWEKANAEVETQKGRLSEAVQGLTNAVAWKRAFEGKDPVLSYSFIMAGDLLFAGRDNAVVAMSAKDGAEVWTGPVTGRAYGLAAAHGRLFASTDQGTIHCFAPGTTQSLGEVNLRKFEHLRTEPSALLNKERLALLGNRAGYALVLADSGVADLCNLTTDTGLRAVVAEPDEARAAALRQELNRFGLQGRVAIHQGAFETLPYPTYFANLVILSAAVKVPPSEIGRVLQPYGGVAVMIDGSLKTWMKDTVPAGAEFVSDRVLRRGPLPGAGEWTHQYANTANTATSGDPYVRGRLEMTWFGDPGPRDMIDRHNRTMAPLVKDGRLFVPANEKIIAVNAYNGVRLWELPVPGSRRVGVLKDSGQMALAADTVYIVVKDKCWALDPATGARKATLSLPDTGSPRDWGYLAVADDLVLGTVQKTNASFGVHCNMCPILEGDFRPVIISESLFALDRKSGAVKWHYRDGALFNSGIAADGSRVYFLEARNEKATTGNRDGRIRVDHFLGGTNSLVALDLKTGAKKWEQPVQLGYQHIVYLQVAGGLVVTMGTYNKEKEVSGKKGPFAHYAFHAFAADTGKPAWQAEIPTGMGPGGSHGEQWQHPVIIGNEILSKYFACDLRTGAPLPEYKGGGPGKCGTWAASASAVFGRGGGRNLDTGQGITLTKISREGCFVNVIPACGVLSVPQTGAGCLCDYPIELSMGFAPADGLTPVIHPLHRKFAEKATVSMDPALKEFPIRYTTDGSDPTENSPLYSQPFEIGTNTTVKARLSGPAPATNAVVAATFTKTAPTATDGN